MLIPPRRRRLHRSSTPVIGVGTGLLFILVTITLSTHRLFAFFNLEGLIIVGGGVIGVAFMSYEAEDVRKALKIIVANFQRADSVWTDNLHQDMMEIIGWAYMVKEHGMRRLEATLARTGIADPFVKYGLTMVVSDYKPEDVRAMMETAADAYFDRESVPGDVLQSMASHAPAFGMIGTLVGMVIMLSNLTDNVSHIGASLSVSFLSTLYGVLCARVVYMPAAAKQRHTAAKRRFRNQLIIEGMVMLVGNRSPHYIKDRLNSFLRPERHDYDDQFKSGHSTIERAVPHLKVVGL